VTADAPAPADAPNRKTIALRTGVTVVIATAGGFAAQATGMPAGWLMGGAVATAAVALGGVKLAMPNWLRDIAFILTGMSMGTNVARDSMSLLAQWPVSLIALAIELAIVIAATGYMLRRFFGLDTSTAYLSSFPGHLSFIMGIASAGLGDPRQITIIQVIRIMMLTICVPAGALFLPVETAAATAVQPMMTNEMLVVLAVLCTAAGFVFTRLNVPAGYVLGAMAAATAAKLGGLFDGVLPPPLQIASYVLIGGLIGARFIGITMTEFRRAALGGFIATVMTVAIVTVIAFIASLFVEMPFGQLWLGLSPGALEGMGALGVALGYDTAFIAAHHVARLLMLTAAIPSVAFLLSAAERKRA